MRQIAALARVGAESPAETRTRMLVALAARGVTVEVSPGWTRHFALRKV